MRLLVTGGAGFWGSCFIRTWMARHPADTVINLDLLTYAGSPERVADIAGRASYRFIQADVCDPRRVAEAIRGCQAVIHFAAETHVDRSIVDSAPFVRTNVVGTATLLDAALAARVERVIYISTDEVYGPVLEGSVQETAPLAPRSPYAASKAAGDLLAQAFGTTHGLPVIVVRPTNVFGPWQLPEKFIPLCITNALDGLPVPVYGDGQQRRAWLAVEDGAEALALITERGAPGTVYNLAGGAERTNYETAAQVLQRLGRGLELLEHVADRPGHDRRYALDDRRLRALGWAPARAFEDALEQTVRWYQAHAGWWRPLVQRLREDPGHWLNRTAGRSPQPQAVDRPA